MKEKDIIDAVNNINLGSDAEEKILNNILIKSYKKERFKMSKKNLCIIAAAFATLFGICAYATSGIVSSWSSHTSSTPKYTELPTSQQVTKDIGYSPKVIKEFKNGYKFDNASIVNNSLNDNEGNSVESFKSIASYYEKDDDKVMFSADKFDSYVNLEGDIIDTVNGIDIYYLSYNNKSVPPEYKMTEEDKKAEESGELVFSYGASEVSIFKVQGLTWTQDGIQYNFTQIDGKLSSDELVEMAKEIIVHQ